MENDYGKNINSTSIFNKFTGRSSTSHIEYVYGYWEEDTLIGCCFDESWERTTGSSTAFTKAVSRGEGRKYITFKSKIKFTNNSHISGFFTTFEARKQCLSAKRIPKDELMDYFNRSVDDNTGHPDDTLHSVAFDTTGELGPRKFTPHKLYYGY